MNINTKRKILENSLSNGEITEDEYFNELENLTNREYIMKDIINSNLNQLIL